MTTSGEPDRSPKLPAKKNPFERVQHKHGVDPHSLIPGTTKRAGAGRQAFTSHVPRQNKRHHKPGK